MARLPEVSELEAVVTQARHLLMTPYSPEEYETRIGKTNISLSLGPFEEKSKRELREAIDKSQRLDEISAPILEAIQYIDSAPKRGFFSRNPFKKHEEQLDLFNQIQEYAVEDMNRRADAYKKSIAYEKERIERKRETAALFARYRPMMNELKARGDTQANDVIFMNDLQKNKSLTATNILNIRSKRIEGNYNQIRDRLTRSVSGGRTRRGRRSHKKTRKH